MYFADKNIITYFLLNIKRLSQVKFRVVNGNKLCKYERRWIMELKENVMENLSDVLGDLIQEKKEKKKRKNKLNE